ncbi:putative leucine-rich repeat receptor protein kinase [Trifolium repens]|nr:putative leucine-rich repeat receptor protein kinase [Trifolium repens]
MLENNQLFGHIPREIGKLVNLKQLLLDRNNLTSYIPQEIGFLKELREICLAVSHLFGTIPSPSIGYLINLETIVLYRNELFGIPLEMVKATNLHIIDFSLNQLTGKIPNELGNLPSLIQL